MGIPTNSGKAKDYGCNPVSSNCVVWQGPDLECFGICHGDTISDVTAKLAAQLCLLVDMFNLENYDFSCLAIPSEDTPQAFNELLQILIERICALEGIDIPEGGNALDCPDNCDVYIAGCFQYQTQQGDTIVQMTLVDYVRAIGELVCSHVNDIITLQGGLTGLDEDGALYAARITAVEEDKVDTTALNYMVNSATNPSAGLQFLPDATREIENSLIRTQSALGTPSEMYNNMLKAGNISNEDQVSGDGLMKTLTGWVITPSKLSESFGNAWLAIRDLRETLAYLQANFISKSCSDIYFDLRATVTPGASNYVTVFADASTGFTADWIECEATTLFKIQDSAGNATTFRTSAIDLISNPSGYQLDITATTVDVSLDITVTAYTCFKNTITDTTCEKETTYVVASPDPCPSVMLTLYSDSIDYQFTSVSGNSYVVNVYYASGSTPVVTQIIGTPPVTVSNTISGLLDNTNYDFELTVTDGSGDSTVCPRTTFTTLTNACTPPTGVVAVLTT